MFEINLSQIAACVEESRLAWLDADKGAPEPTHYAELVAALEVARLKLPPLYRTAAGEPFLTAIKALGAAQFAQVLHKDPTRESTGGLMITSHRRSCRTVRVTRRRRSMRFRR